MKNKRGVGNPTILTDELSLQIRRLVLNRLEIVDIQKELNILPNTWDSWYYRNTQGFRDLMTQWRHERMIKKAEQVIDDSLHSDDEKIKLDAAKYTTERLDKKHYSNRSELTDGNGEKLEPLVIVKTNGD